MWCRNHGAVVEDGFVDAIEGRGENGLGASFIYVQSGKVSRVTNLEFICGEAETTTDNKHFINESAETDTAWLSPCMYPVVSF